MKRAWLLRLLVITGLVFLGAIPAVAAAPSNDDFDSAMVITTLPFTDTVDTTEATVAPDDPYLCWYLVPNATIWYAFTPLVDMRIVATVSATDASVAVYTGARSALGQLSCDYNTIEFNATAGTTYYFLISNFYGDPVKTFSVDRMLPPANDDVDHATPITQLPFTEPPLDTRAASTASTDPPSCVSQSATVWYTFTPTEDTRIVANTFGSSYDTVLAVYSGAPGRFILEACNDNINFTWNSEVVFTATAGVTYFFMIGVFDGYSAGQLTFSVTGQPPLKIGVTIDRFGSVDTRTGVATMSGTVTCSRPIFISLHTSLQQKVGRFVIIKGSNFTQAQCTGVLPWSATISSPDGAFGGGAALAAVVATGSDPQTGESANTEVSITIQLRGAK